LIALQGHRVVLLEREAQPRYKIGESLLPSTVHGSCPFLASRASTYAWYNGTIGPGSGVRVELIERRGGDLSDESVEELFRTFEAQDLY
jgi:hypothetical protein